MRARKLNLRIAPPTGPARRAGYSTRVQRAAHAETSAPGVPFENMARITIDELLAEARRGLTRLEPGRALAAMRDGATLIDIRSDAQIVQDGVVPGALRVSRNVLEWRLDPASGYSHPRAPDLDEQVILMCDEGYQSSLAAATLQQLGFAKATDLVGGFQAWRAAGLPIERTAP
jgi:rhodanese-related sulfurtransferase